MKRSVVFFVCLAMTVMGVAALVGCAPTENGGPDGVSGDKTITGVAFADSTFDYDGELHEITVQGALPDGVIVAYENNGGVNAGTYEAKATLSGDGYKTLVLDATLTINKLEYDMTGAKWDYSEAFTYDGTQKTVEVTNLPNGVSVSGYVGNAQTDVGDYTATVKLDWADKTNYNASMSALKWKINKAEITTEIKFDSKTFEYDAQPHGLEYIGNLPNGVAAKVYYDGSLTEPTAPGKYAARLELSGKNYITKILEATLTIRSTEELLYSYVTSGGNVYFQNALDNNKLYTVASGKPTKVSNDVPDSMVGSGNKIYYFSKGLFNKSIKAYDGSATSQLFSESGESLATDGTYLYYAVNNLIAGTDKNGIYKAKADGSGEPARICTDKADHLTCLGGYVYYANKSDGDKLYKVSASASNVSGSLMYDNAVEYIITDGTDLFFNAGGLLSGKAVFMYDVSASQAKKLTTDSGKYLAAIGDHIFYVNNDKLTSDLFGDGIYKVSKSGSLVGEKVVSAQDGDGYSSLASDGTYLYYYRLNDKHFYKMKADGTGEVDLMSGFVPPVETVTLSGYSTAVEHDGSVYYTDPRDGGCLYKYDPATGGNVKVLADSVSKMYFHNDGTHDYMYYGTYIATNYALWRLDLNSGEIIKITSKRIENLIFEGDKIYATRIDGLGSNEIVSMDLDGSNLLTIDNKSTGKPKSTVFDKVGDKFYYLSGDYLCAYKAGDTDKTEIYKATYFAMLDNKIYFFADTANADASIAKNSLVVCDLDGGNVTTIKTDVNITYMHADDGKIYFSSSSTQNDGFFVYDIANGNTKKISDKSAHGVAVCDGNVYFLQSKVTKQLIGDYPAQDKNCDGKLYRYNGTSVTAVN